MPPTFFRSAKDGQEDEWERATRSTTTDHLECYPAFPTVQKAVAAALDGNGGGALAVDGEVARAILGGMTAFKSADPLLRRIRMIKSVHEIGLMRIAAQTNCEAARAAIQSIRIGDRIEDLQRAFFAETGRRGGKPVFISADHSSYRNRNGEIAPGRCFSIDAVGSYAGYHGDYGRTIVVGEPTKMLREAIDAAILCNDAVSNALRPGLHYSDIIRIGREAIAKAGHDILTPATTHSVGLFHTDEAFAGDGASWAKGDHLIEENMIVSIDCPMLQTDMGGTVHLEDLWLVTADGCEPINDTSDPFYTLSA